jgi:hypothetical protein
MSRKDEQDEITEEIVEEPLSNDEIMKYLPNAKIIRYSELKKYNDIDDLLRNNVDYCILLYEESKNKGHWVCVLKYNDTIEYFDSYGGYPDNPLKWNSDMTNNSLGQEPFLCRMFDNTEKEVIFNPIKYQEDEDDVNTCGRHCVFRILNLLEKERELGQYYEIMKEIKKLTKSSYDDIVANMINIM